MSGHVAAVVLLRADGAALLQLRDDKPGLKHAAKWVPPGGHCEPGEPMEVCAKREFAEETDYQLDDLHHLLDFVDDEHEALEPSYVTVYWSVYDGAQPLTCREGQALEFIRRPDAPAYPIPEYLVRVWDRALDAYREKGGAAGRA